MGNPILPQKRMKPERKYFAQRVRERGSEELGTAIAKVVQNDGLDSAGGRGRRATTSLAHGGSLGYDR